MFSYQVAISLLIQEVYHLYCSEQIAKLNMLTDNKIKVGTEVSYSARKLGGGQNDCGFNIFYRLLTSTCNSTQHLYILCNCWRLLIFGIHVKIHQIH